jgi:hypothetical protein
MPECPIKAPSRLDPNESWIRLQQENETMRDRVMIEGEQQ